METPIVAWPIGPGLLRRCPKCRAWRALRATKRGLWWRMAAEPTQFRCRHCRHAVRFEADRDCRSLY